MKLFFTLDLILVIASLTSSVLWISYYTGSLPWLLCGGVLYAIFRIGLVMEYIHDKENYKRWRWFKMLFDKNYTLEILINIVLTFCTLLLALNLWRGFFSGTVFHATWILSLLLEFGFKYILLYADGTLRELYREDRAKKEKLAVDVD